MKCVKVFCSHLRLVEVLCGLLKLVEMYRGFLKPDKSAIWHKTLAVKNFGGSVPQNVFAEKTLVDLTFLQSIQKVYNFGD